MKGRTVTHIPLEEAEGKQRLVPRDHPLISAARNVGTCFG
jgi:6-phosphofructokinase 1